MTATQQRLPVKGSLTLATIFSLIVALLMAGVSAAGLLNPAAFYPADDLLTAFAPNDAVNVAVGVPLLLIALWLARRGRLIGLLMWPGALFYIPYTYLPYLLGLPVGPLFVPYAILVALSLGTLIGLIAAIDGEGVRQRVEARVPARLGGGILLGLGALIVLRQSGLAVSALGDPAGVDALERATWIADLLIASPALLVVGVQLWRRKPLGYAAGAGLFLAYSLLVAAIFPVVWFQTLHGGSPLGVADIVVLLVMAGLCFAPFVFFARGAADRQMAG